MLEEIKKLPKVELHVHLDGSLNPKMVMPYVKGKSLEEVKDILNVDSDTDTLNKYLEKFAIPSQILQTKDNLRHAACDLVNMFKEDNIIYAEVRFAPQFHTSGGLSYDEIITSVLNGLKNSYIKINLILCCMRGGTNEENLKTVEYAHRYLNKGVVGIDLAGAEALYPTSDYKYVFDRCQALRIPYTIHAGEASGSKSINDALDMATKRIGHGIKYDNMLLKRYLNSNITLEICPTSNINTKAIIDIKDHPVYDLYQRGILVTINTDNRTVSNTNLNNEYLLLANTFGFTIEDFKRMNINAINAAFISDVEKDKLLSYFE